MSRKIPARAAGPRAAPPPIELDPRLTIVQAAELHRTMAARLEGNWPVIVDGTRVEEIDTAVLQLLTSLWCTGRERGIASEVAVVSSRRWAIVHELGQEPEPPLADILQKLSPVDLVIVEGFKRHAHPKLEVFRASVGKALLHPDDDCIVAIATDAPLPQAAVPVLMLDDIEGIANVLQAEAMPRDQIGSPREMA